jgi:hypothetical protein
MGLANKSGGGANFSEGPISALFPDQSLYSMDALL